MIIDSSAIMAVMLDEPERDAIVRTILASDGCWLSSGGWVELSTVLTRSGRSSLFIALDEIMAMFNIQIAPTAREQAEIAHDAYRRFGIGSGHPARLNFGDCFAYALAIATGEPLLFNGDDFTHTDVIRASY